MIFFPSVRLLKSRSLSLTEYLEVYMAMVQNDQFGTAKFKVVPSRCEDFPFTQVDMSVSKRVSFSVMSSQDQSTPPVCLMEGFSF